jgi:hypothetical protein
MENLKQMNLVELDTTELRQVQGGVFTICLIGYFIKYFKK